MSDTFSNSQSPIEILIQDFELSKCAKENQPHKPVMVKEVLDFLKPKDNGIYIDGTFGAGGHTRAILSSANCIVHAIDRDSNSLAYANEFDKTYNICGKNTYENNSYENQRFYHYHCRFSQLKEKLPAILYDGVLIDLGVSSMQLNQKERGFSFQKDGPLSMAMGCNDTTAEEIINDYSPQLLSKIIFEYGEEIHGEKIAIAIYQARHYRRIESTKQLADIIHKAVGTERYGKINSATKTFQAIRIAVNDEMNELTKVLQEASSMLNVNGTLIVICFHALEIRIVKQFTRTIVTPCIKKKMKYKCKEFAYENQKRLPIESSERLPIFRNLTSHSFKPSRNEVITNPRARSALIRAIRRDQ